MTDGYLVLEDGTAFEGQLFGAEIEKAGYLTFSTGGSDGYQEALTDPASRGQLIAFTFPCVGNYGVLPEFDQSDAIQANGLVVSEVCTEPSPQYGGIPLSEYMKEKGAAGITGVDTRALMLKLRECGSMRAAIVRAGTDLEAAAKDLARLSNSGAVAKVSPSEPYLIDNDKTFKIAVIDCGARKGLFDRLSKFCDIHVFPYDATASQVMESGAVGVIVSSGPGDSDDPVLATAISTVKALSEEVPILGISLGCDIVAQAMGAKVQRMPVGHHGCNQPVKVDGRVNMTAQSHDFCIDRESAEAAGLEIVQTNLNDGTVEGFEHSSLPVYGYEYHPEGCCGPDDCGFVLEEFIEKCREASQ